MNDINEVKIELQDTVIFDFNQDVPLEGTIILINEFDNIIMISSGGDIHKRFPFQVKVKVKVK